MLQELVAAANYSAYCDRMENTEPSMARVGGVVFRCPCGCNVFTRDKRTDVFTCNACNARYQGER